MAMKTTKAVTAMMEKTGWQSGKGLGRDEQGAVEHVRVSQKDGALGIGYTAQVQQVWSVQSVAFADVLARIAATRADTDAAAADGDDGEADDDGDGAEESGAQASGRSGVPAAGKHAVAYAKRRRLKTEGLASGDGKAEILAAASTSARRRPRDDDSDGSSGADGGAPSAPAPAAVAPMTLTSPLLRRLCERVAAHEPRRTIDEAADENPVVVEMPDPKPAKCTASPFLVGRSRAAAEE
jgi:Pin2-interacting protein X1